MTYREILDISSAFGKINLYKNWILSFFLMGKIYIYIYIYYKANVCIKQIKI